MCETEQDDRTQSIRHQLEQSMVELYSLAAPRLWSVAPSRATTAVIPGTPDAPRAKENTMSHPEFFIKSSQELSMVSSNVAH